MSLLEDARRDVSPALKAEMLARYRCGVGEADWGGFQRTFDVLAAQRHAKVIGIFTRLCQRDGKSGYLVHIPRVWQLLEQALASASLAPVARWFDRHLPSLARVIPSPAEAAVVRTPTSSTVDARPRQAMVLAAGLGLRMRPITERLPKTLIEIGGRSMLDRVIDGLEAQGIEQVVVNAHHLAPLVERHLARRCSPPIRLSVEAALQDPAAPLRMPCRCWAGGRSTSSTAMFSGATVPRRRSPSGCRLGRAAHGWAAAAPSDRNGDRLRWAR